MNTTMAANDRKPPEAYVAEIETNLANFQASGKSCCGRDCLNKVPTKALAAHLIDVHLARSLGYRGWWFWLRTQ